MAGTGRRHLVKELVGAPEPGHKAQTEVRAFFSASSFALGQARSLEASKKEQCRENA